MTNEQAIKILQNHDVRCWIHEGKVIAVEVTVDLRHEVHEREVEVEASVECLREFLNY